jgi:hypothetical protein
MLSAAVFCRAAVRSLCRHFGFLLRLGPTRQTATVRKGSPVRIRQRALENPLETAGSFVARLERAAIRCVGRLHRWRA